MKNRLIASLAVLALMVVGVLCITVKAQTTEPGPGPTEQPDAPLEIGQAQPGPQAPAQAQNGDPSDSEPSGQQAAETDQGAARISMFHGDVSTQRGDSGDWSAVVLNQPVMTGDKVSTGDNGRTEVQLDFANILRLGAKSQVNVVNLTRKNIQVQVGQGIVNYTVFKESETEPEIDTPNVSVHPAHHDGVFRIEVRPDGDTIVIVRKGEAQISTPQGSTEIRAGEMATIRGTSNDAQYKVSSAPDRDDFDRWNSERDHVIRNAKSWGHTNRYYTGSEDLDSYGHWKNVPDYGDVWVPNESADWAPYRDGNWVWEPYYGWTWVGYEPWGWAPYHYGRWFWWDSAWVWWPGPVGGFYRPFWAPAYVSFFGWGGGWGFGVGFGGWGGFGWLPIGPCDWFNPWWGGFGGRFGFRDHDRFRDRDFGRRDGFRPLHAGNRFSNLNHINDPHIGRGVSTLGAGHFGAGHVRPMPATREQLRGARQMTGNLPVVPTRASLSASGRAAAPSTIRSGGTQRFFGTQHNVARPASFEQQTARLQQSMQRSHITPVAAGGGRLAASGSAGFGTSARGTVEKPSAGTMSRETTSPVSRSAGTGTTPQNGNRGGFRSFTPPTNSGVRSSSPTRMENPRSTSPSVENGNRGSFRPFTPPSRSQVGSAGRNNSSGGYWNRTAPSSQERGYGPASHSYGGGSRPQLDMRQPIVEPRSSGGYGGYRGAPSYGGSRGGYSGGSRSAPSYGGGGSHGGGYSGGGGHPSGGGGGGHSSSGGGGGHASGGSGGGHSSGGHSSGGHH